jgi:hypothetical protein
VDPLDLQHLLGGLAAPEVERDSAATPAAGCGAGSRSTGWTCTATTTAGSSTASTATTTAGITW